VFISLFVFGVISLFYLDFDLVPDISYPELWVLTSYPGGTPGEVKNLISVPVEESCLSLKGVKRVESTSRESLSLIKILYRWGQDIDTARIELREKLDLLKSFFPREVERPVIAGYQTSAQGIIGISVVSRTMDGKSLYLFCKKEIVPVIEKAEGAARVSIQGGERPRVKIILSPENLVKYNLGIESIIERLSLSHKDFPVGTFSDEKYEYVVRVKTEFDDYRKLSGLVLKETGNRVVHLGDVARIEYGIEKKKGDVLIDGSEVLLLTVYKRPSANIISVSKEVNRKIVLLKERYSSDIKFEKVFDRSTYIRNSIKELSFALVFGILCTLFSVYFFIADLKASFLIVFTVPLCIVFTFIVMKVQDISVNLLTLGGFVLALGMIVDNSVIVVTALMDTIYRRETLKSFYPELKRVTPAVFSTTLTTIVVFLPVLFLEGILKVLFLQLSVVIVMCLLFSLVLSITLVPLLLEPKGNVKKRAGDIFIRVCVFLENCYGTSLAFVLRKKGFFSIILIFFLTAGILSYTPLKKCFMESMPQDHFYLSLFIKEPVSFNYTIRFMETVSDIIKSDRRVEKIIAFIGDEKADVGDYQDALLGQNSGVLKIYSWHGGEAIYNLIESIKNRLSIFGDVDFVFTIPDNPVQRLISRSDFDVKVNIYHRSDEFLAEVVKKVHLFLKQNDLASDILSSYYFTESEQALLLKREKLSFLGLETSKVTEYLHTALSGTRVGNWRKNEDDIPVFLHFNQNSFNDIEELLSMQVKNTYGEMVKLEEVLKVEQVKAPNYIMRNNQKTFARVEFNLNRKKGSFFFHRGIDEEREKIEKYLTSEGIDFEYIDEFSLLRENYTQLVLSLLLAVFLEYVILASLFRSFSKPILVISMVPVSMPGLFSILYFLGSSLNLNTFMSMIVLVGLMVNNAIMLFLQYEDEKVHNRSGIVRASVKRLKPILVTTISTVLALVPTLFTGNKIQVSLSLTLITGLLYSTAITIFYLPMYYHTVYVRQDKA